ncbi:DsbA family oxidoreductase [Daejeonella sp. H1SJ63]|uniref:DsbA family oxidoreductase n=1 Tax=Daejeonella sp. H1SJ63 TaxID=3034145 RepID=UPI0023EA7BF1|nr:DsbA family oxidoreductase [Daejeonella sp. H1SJ63]
MNQKKMHVEIWSDVMCPFCYIGKRRFEKALDQISGKENIEIIWKSYQLAPDLKTDSSKNINQYLSEHKGISLEHAQQMNDQVTRMAAGEGLVYNFDKAIVANSMNAHRFSHFAKQYSKQNDAEELLFRAYFTDGKNTDDQNTLIELGNEIGLDPVKLKSVLESQQYADEVRADILEAQQIGVRGVPFFVFDRKYAISGAQESQAFSQVLEKSFAEWKEQNPALNMKTSEGQVCTQDEGCN